MLLHDLLIALHPRIELRTFPNLPVRAVQEDSRRVEPGDLFVARAGTKTDGRAFLNQAQQRGAVAAVVSGHDPQSPLPQVIVRDPGVAASILANILWGAPSVAVKVLGVTGTNGKTTTAYLVRHLLRKAHISCGLIGTVEIDDGKHTWEAAMTTPSAPDVASLLGKMRDNGCRGCAMEVSSHALDQGRVAGVTFAASAFTNLTRDHLDYHKTTEKYAAAKSRLFAMLDREAVAVVNVGSEWSRVMVQDCPARKVGFGFNASADYRAEKAAISSQGTIFDLVAPDGRASVHMGLIGNHNIENALTAAALAGQAFGLSVDQIAAGLSDAAGAPGRLQTVRGPGAPGFAVLVDYAHTDDALRNVLIALRPLTRRRLRVLFGCGGDRDRGKRPLMAEVAEKLADAVYVTSDNPRTEMPVAIITDIVAGFSAGFKARTVIEPDRRCAIERVLADAEAGDVVLIAGKGHENYQIIGTTKHHFDDVEEATRVLSSRVRAA
jgi:UDP-N-acetylmuramoyl-L-alanyl-D-glutamate--2,6-diaminopimelate ligase